MRYFYIVICLVLSPYFSFSQDSNLGNWILVFGNKPLSEKLNWHHEVQYRNYNAVGDLEQLLLRTGLGVDINSQANLLQGYAFIRSENYTGSDEKSVVNEHRLYQQLITKQSIRSLRMQHRYRFEQRFVESDFRLRFRYFLGLAYPVMKIEDTDKELYLSAYNEIFLNTVNNVFDRNRLYGGIGFKINKSVRLELGYMNQFLNGGSRDQLNIVTFLNW